MDRHELAICRLCCCFCFDFCFVPSVPFCWCSCFVVVAAAVGVVVVVLFVFLANLFSFIYVLEGLTVSYAFEQLSNLENMYQACSLCNILVGEQKRAKTVFRAWYYSVYCYN